MNNKITLNSDQEKAVSFIKSWWSGRHMYMILDGKGGSGKGLPLDEPILTPQGWVTNGSLTLGTTIYDASGEETEVIGIYELGDVNMYNITFTDGSSVRCCEDHLWKIQTARLRHSGKFDVRYTKDLLDYKQERFIPGHNKVETIYKYRVPLTKPINFDTKCFTVDPYTLGYTLGNGYSGKSCLQLSLSKHDTADILKNLAASHVLSNSNRTATVDVIALNKLTRENYKNLGLSQVKSLYKFIPTEYFLGSIAQRKALLSGLLDSDGSCCKNRVTYSSSSLQLITDVQQLVRSLGGKARLYTHDRPNKVNVEYVLQLRTPFNPFRLPRKGASYKVISFDNSKTIIDITSIGKIPGRCIKVAAETKLYITKDYTVTHNTTLLNEVLKELPQAAPILLCPTHESLKQLRDKVEGDYEFKTYHAALGISPIEDSKELEFKQRELPKMWDNFNLAIVDECSQIPMWVVRLLIDTGVKILWTGHSSQLPPVDKKRGIFDKCISPVFTLGYPTVTLTIPQRNTGALWEFNNILESNIHTSVRIIPNTFNISKLELTNYMASAIGKEGFLAGDTKVVMYSNAGVDRYNELIRVILFGELAKTERYLAKDKIILTKPLIFIDKLERYDENELKRLTKSKELVTLYANTKAEVIACEQVTIRLNKSLQILCYKLLVICNDDEISLYEPINTADWKLIEDYYEHAAWNCGDKRAKIRAYQDRRFILSCFSDIKGFFAATTYRMQGSTVPNVIVVTNDIAKVPNLIEQKKHLYVGASRVRDRLMMFRGV